MARSGIFSYFKLLFLLIILSACSFDPANTEYAIDITESGRALLKDGIYEESAAPGSASKIIVRLDTPRAFGDINGEGTDDAAIILNAEGGGSGTFSYLAVVLDYSGSPAALDAVLIGDRVSVESVEISDDEVHVDYLGRASGESMSDTPTVKQRKSFRFENGELAPL